MLDISFDADLDTLRKGLAGCRMLAFVDLSSRMVLKVSAQERPPREEIDALGDLAALCLDGRSLPQLFDGEPPFSAAVTGETESSLFIRSLTDPGDALIVVTDAPLRLASVWSRVQDVLDRHAAGEATR